MPNNLLSRFFANEKGNYAVIFALISLPLIGLSGVLADYGRAESLRSKLHSATDAAAIAVSQEVMGRRISASDSKQRAKEFLLANLGEQYADDLKLDLELPTPGDRTFRLKTSLRYRPTFGPLLVGIAGGNADRFDYIIE